MSDLRGTSGPTRYQLSRAGVLNVWQYDEQVFEFGGGRLLLRGTNGAGKSKTLELLLPFCIDGDRQRMNASGRAQTPLTWLMLDGVDDRLRTGYVWVEFERRDDTGQQQHLTCGVGLRASRSSGSVTTWMFCTAQRIGADLALEDADGPLSSPALKAALGPQGRHFDVARDYRAHVGQLLFGLDPGRYDDLLRLLYWLRQPQIGEEIEPKRIAAQLVQSLPELDADELTRAGQTLDELAAFGEKLRRTEAARAAVAGALDVYSRYARAVTGERARSLVDADKDRRRIQRTLHQQQRELAQIDSDVDVLLAEQASTTTLQRSARAELDLLALDPDEARLDDARARAETAEAAAASLSRAAERADLACSSAQTARASMLRAAEQTARSIDADVRMIAELAGKAQIPIEAGFAADGSATALLGVRSVPSADATAIWVAEHTGALDAMRQSAAVTTAALVEARDLAREHERLAAKAHHASAEAERAAARADELRLTAAGLHETAAAQARAWRDAVHSWAADAAAVAIPVVDAARGVDVDHLLEATTFDDVPDRVAKEAAGVLEDRRRTERALALDVLAAQRGCDGITDELEVVRRERDPAPPIPPLPRDRDGDPTRAGRPLWAAIDFVDGTPDEVRAAVEAALQQSGLLDAWIDPEGPLRDGVFDIVARASHRLEGPTLTEVLRPADEDPRVSALLASIRLSERPGVEDDDLAVVGLDGTFRLGPLHGRAKKPGAQYIGASARAAERGRRIAALEGQLAELERALALLTAQHEAADAEVIALQTWLRSVPATHELARARDRLDDARRALSGAEATARLADDAAVAARRQASHALSRLDEWALAHGIPVDLPALDAVRDVVRDLTAGIGRHRDALGGLVAAVTDLAAAGARADEAAVAQGEAHAEGDRARDEAAALRHAYDSLTRALSESLAALAARRFAAQAALSNADARLVELAEGVSTRREQRAVTAERLTRVLDDEGRHRTAEQSALEAFCRLREVPGLLAAAVGEVPEGQDRLLAAGGAPRDRDALPADLLAIAAEWASLATADTPVDANAILRMHSELATGEAATHEPALSDIDGTYAITARDGAAQLTLAGLSVELTRRVAQQSELLTSRERDAFEQVLLGSLGDELRRRLQEAHELVSGMNDLLLGIRTSQGIRVKLRWRVRDDAPPEARDVARLVARSTAALLPDERDRLHQAMSQLLALAADDAPDDGYALHLQRALDYRTWYEFTVQYRRPGADAWLDLSRRSPLSQGEQKVACYLPLFAAAAAHFTSVAGAAPHAPRFVLLDDAFPKIDARTHPLLFGLLVQLDLDFVITSERLWGDHAELPALGIYEALRNPGEPGIAQAHYTWDGRALHAAGMP